MDPSSAGRALPFFFLPHAIVMKMDSGRLLKILFSIGGILILAALIWKVGLERWETLLRGMDKTALLWAPAVYALAWLFRTLRLRSLLRHRPGSLSLSRTFEIHIAGFALNAVLPVKAGDVAMVGLLKREGIRIGAAAAMVVQTRILDILAMVLVMIPSWFWLTRKDAPLWMLSSFLICLALAAVPFGIAWADQQRKISSLAAKAGEKTERRLWGLALVKFGEAYDAYHGMARDRSLLLRTVLASILVWLCEGGVCYVLFSALGVGIPFEAAVLAVVLGNAGKGFQVTPGGIGVYEGILTVVLCEFGAPFDAAVTVAVLDHLLKKGFNLAIGLYALVRLGGFPGLRSDGASSNSFNTK